MKKYKLNNTLRRLIIIILILAIIGASYVNYASYQSSLPHKIFVGDELAAEVTCFTKGILYFYPYGENVTIGNITKTHIISYIGISTFATLYKNALYNSTVVYNQPYYFLKITKELFIKTNISGIQYNVYLVTPYYNKLVYSNFSHSGLIPLNLTYLINLSNVINNEIGVSVYPIISITINNSALINVTTVNGDVISVKLVKNYIAKEIVKPLYGKLISLTSYPLSDLYMLYVNLGFYPNLTEGNYSLILQISNLNFTLSRGKLNSLIPLNLTQIYDLAENLTLTYKLEPVTPVIYIDIKAKMGNITLYPYIVINDNNGYITTSIYNNTYYYPIYEVVDANYSLIGLSYVIVPAILLAFMLLFTESKKLSMKDLIMKKLNKYKKIVVHVEKAEFNNAKIVRVKDLNELLKISAILSKPIMLNENKLWIEDDGVIYLLEV
ncbi:DUF5305 family protein [Sulfurisphaera javensis]|uniref:DUF5305 family protein n=1 Tax=Sulfurisphaera javensis TaxID=2049879 RepID=A0AAT9GVH3_9CREN